MSVSAQTAKRDRIGLLLAGLGIDPSSFEKFLEWALCEHLVSTLCAEAPIHASFFSQPDALKRFIGLLRERTGRNWSHEDADALFERVKADTDVHYRKPIEYGELLKLLWQVPLECAYCKKKPPAVRLHIDHIVPASKGGSSRRHNLQFLCAEDNLKKSNKREVTGPWLSLL